MEANKFEVKKLLYDKKFWFASFIITWAAALQGHMMWLKRQDSFKQKFGNLDQISEQKEIGDNDLETDSNANEMS